MLDNPDVDAGQTTDTASHESDFLGLQLIDLLARRRSVAPLRLSEPGPSPDEVRKLLTVATRVPDHGMLQPWRIILVHGTAREKLGAELEAAFLKANPDQEPANSDLAIRKIKAVLAAPLVVIVVSRADPSARIPEWEQILSAGAVCMNLIAAASALGYGSTWLTGWTAYDPAALRILGVQLNERVAGIIPIGTVSEPQQDRVRPSLQKLTTMWTAL
jgi:nitroreductase